MSRHNAPQSRQEQRRQQCRQRQVQHMHRIARRRWLIIGAAVVLFLIRGGGGAYVAISRAITASTTLQAGTAIDGLQGQAETMSRRR